MSRPLRTVLTGTLMALTLPASLLFTTSQSAASSETTDSSSVAAANKKKANKRKKTNINVRVLPPIAQQGKKPAGAGKARVVFTGQVKPKRKGRVVVLQRKDRKRWKVVARTKTVAQGKYTLTGPAQRNKQFRVVVRKNKNFRLARTKPTRINARWFKPTFQDQFAGKSLRPVWSHRGQDYYAQSLRECSKGDPRATRVAQGRLRLSVMKDPRRTDKCDAKRDGVSTGKYSYRLNGHVGTEGRFGFRYGFAAARMKMQPGRGQHSAFWLVPEAPSKATPDVGGAEIDIVEYMGDKHARGGLTSFIHAYDRNLDLVKTGGWLQKPRQYLAGKKDGWSTHYHVFSVEWTPKEYIFRIDGQETLRIKDGVSKVRQYPVLSLLSSDYALNLVKNENRDLPQHAHVDWIRVWEVPRP